MVQTGSVADGGVVREFHADEGWGVIEGPAVPGGCWVHFSVIAMDGYRQLEVGQQVRFRAEAAEQDGYGFRALQVWTDGGAPDATPSGPSGDAYRSSLTLTFDEPGTAGAP